MEKKTQDNNYRPKDRPVTELPKYCFKVCTKCPKHTWFLRNLLKKKAAAARRAAEAEAVIKQAVLQALAGGLTIGSITPLKKNKFTRRL